MNFVELLFKGAILFVTSDFIKDGDDYILGSQLVAEQLAQEYEAILPTPELVDEIYAQATCKPASPALNPADPTSPYKHNKVISKNKEKCENKTLIAGHKKNIVQTDKPGRTAIYGWFSNGKRIQPYSTVHAADYVDYSQAIRLISKWALKDGKLIPASTILNGEDIRDEK